MIEKLEQWAKRRNYRVAWGSVDAIVKTRDKIRRQGSSGQLAKHLFDDIEPLLSGELPGWANTVVMLAVPRPAHRLSFDLGSKPINTLLPPTYYQYRNTYKEVRQALQTGVFAFGRVEQLNAPLKTVASLLGLVAYGRNNVSYVEGLGSYFQLCGYVTDAQLSSAGPLAEPRLLAECEGCEKCIRRCPTGAITEDRILIRAHRCLTYLNENEGEWPDWVSPRIHHCLLGCLICQKTCPANRKLPVETCAVSFSQAETTALLAGPMKDDHPLTRPIRDKLKRLDQPFAEPVLGRNLKALYDKRASGKIGRTTADSA